MDVLKVCKFGDYYLGKGSSHMFSDDDGTYRPVTAPHM